MRATSLAVGAQCGLVKTRSREIGCRGTTRKKVAIVGRGEDVHFVHGLTRVSFERREDYGRRMLVSARDRTDLWCPLIGDSVRLRRQPALALENVPRPSCPT
jgi:hypothetical protein